MSQSSGRGPTTAMSPRSTFHSWGSSSILKRRSTRPTGAVERRAGGGELHRQGAEQDERPGQQQAAGGRSHVQGALDGAGQGRRAPAPAGRGGRSQFDGREKIGHG